MTWTPVAWEETREGPPLEALTHHLAECPPDFLGVPMCVDGTGEVHVGAVVSDLLLQFGARALAPQEAERLGGLKPKDSRQRNRLRCVLVAAWALHWFQRGSGWEVNQEAARGFLLEGLDEFAQHVNASQLVVDADRREEVARTALRGVGYRPQGESVAVAQDRLTTMSSAERVRVMRESRAAEERAAKVREELRRKAEEEAAAAWNRE